jgi:hypothetical protein
LRKNHPRGIIGAMGRFFRYDSESDSVVEREAPAERRATEAKWPIACVASGVHPSQANELREFLQKSGVPTEVTSDGDPVYRNASHQRNALKVRGLVNRSSYC